MNRSVQWLFSLKKECPTCTGAGRIACSCNENHELVCPNCSGKGVVARQVTATQKVEMPCDNPQCQKGKVTCGVCNGTGQTADGAACKACHGTGKTDCPVCGGLGRIRRLKQESWTEHETCHVCNGRGMVECYLCHGEKERVCPTCKGDGVVWNTGKLAFFAVMAVLLVAMPVVCIALLLLALGGCGFWAWKQRKTQSAEDDAQTDTQETTGDPVVFEDHD